MKHSLFLLAALGTLAACADEPPTEVVAAASSVDLTICHNGHTISIGQAAWPAHQAHGDTRGACGTGCPVTAGALTVVDFRADVGVTTVAGGRVSRWHDQSGNGRDAIAATGPTLVTDQMGRSVLRFDGDGAMLIAPPYVPASGTLFIVYGGRNGVQASGRPMGWGDSAVGGHGIDILAIPGFGVDAIFRANFEAGDLASTPNASTMEVDTLSWGVAGLLFERRFTVGDRRQSARRDAAARARRAAHTGPVGEAPLEQ